MIPIKIRKFSIQNKILCVLFLFLIIFFFFKFKINYIRHNYYTNLKLKKPINENNFKNITFAIIRRTSCKTCGLFSDYIVYLGCINLYINKGFLPIIDMQTYRNIFNEFNVSKTNGNPWEFFFEQPYGQSLDNLKKKQKASNILSVEQIFLDLEVLFFIIKIFKVSGIISQKFIYQLKQGF